MATKVSTATAASEAPCWNFVVVGSEGCGKTKLIEREDYKRTGIEQFSASIKVASKPAKLNIWDLGGHISLSDLQSQAFLNSADVILLCYDLSRPQRAEEIDSKLEYFGTKMSSNGFLFLVGCKSDERLPLSEAEEKSLEEIAARHDAKCFAVSSKSDVGVSSVFLDAIRYAYAVYLEERQQRMQREMERANDIDKRSRWLMKHVSRGDPLQRLIEDRFAHFGSVEKLFTALAEKLEYHDSATVAYLKKEENLLYFVKWLFTPDPQLTLESFQHGASLLRSPGAESFKVSLSLSESALKRLWDSALSFANRRLKEERHSQRLFRRGRPEASGTSSLSDDKDRGEDTRKERNRQGGTQSNEDLKDKQDFEEGFEGRAPVNASAAARSAALLRVPDPSSHHHVHKGSRSRSRSRDTNGTDSKKRKDKEDTNDIKNPKDKEGHSKRGRRWDSAESDEDSASEGPSARHGAQHAHHRSHHRIDNGHGRHANSNRDKNNEGNDKSNEKDKSNDDEEDDSKDNEASEWRRRSHSSEPRLAAHVHELAHSHGSHVHNGDKERKAERRKSERTRRHERNRKADLVKAHEEGSAPEALDRLRGSAEEGNEKDKVKYEDKNTRDDSDKKKVDTKGKDNDLNLVDSVEMNARQRRSLRLSVGSLRTPTLESDLEPESEVTSKPPMSDSNLTPRFGLSELDEATARAVSSRDRESGSESERHVGFESEIESGKEGTDGNSSDSDSELNSNAISNSNDLNPINSNESTHKASVASEQERLLYSLLQELLDTQPLSMVTHVHEFPYLAHKLWSHFDDLSARLMLALFRAEQQLFVLSGASDRRSLFETLHLGPALLESLHDCPRATLSALSYFLNGAVEIAPEVPVALVAFDDFELVRRLLHLLASQRSLASLIVQVLSESVLRIYVTRAPNALFKPVTRVFAHHLNALKLLLYSRSSLENFLGVDLVSALYDLGAVEVVRPLLGACVSLLFERPRASVIGFAVTKLLCHALRDRRSERLWPYVFGDGSLLQRLAALYADLDSGDPLKVSPWLDLAPLCDQILLKLHKHILVDSALAYAPDVDGHAFLRLVSRVVSSYEVLPSSSDTDSYSDEGQGAGTEERRGRARHRAMRSLTEMLKSGGGGLDKEGVLTRSRAFTSAVKRVPQITQPTFEQRREKERLLLTLATANKAGTSAFDSS